MNLKMQIESSSKLSWASLYATVSTMTGKFYQNMLLAFVHVYTNLPVKLKTDLNKTKTKLQQNSSKFAYLIGSKMLLPKSTAVWLMWLSYNQSQ
jgi:hypothetical protein